MNVNAVSASKKYQFLQLLHNSVITLTPSPLQEGRLFEKAFCLVGLGVHQSEDVSCKVSGTYH